MSCVEAVYLIWISEKAASLGIEAVEKLVINFFSKQVKSTALESCVLVKFQIRLLKNIKTQLFYSFLKPRIKLFNKASVHSST